MAKLQKPQINSPKLRRFVEDLKANKVPEVLAQAKTFYLTFSRKELKLITMAHEMQWNPVFYEMLGRNYDEVTADAMRLIRERYAKFLVEEDTDNG